MIKSLFKRRTVFLGMLALITGSSISLKAQTNPATKVSLPDGRFLQTLHSQAM